MGLAYSQFCPGSISLGAFSDMVGRGNFCSRPWCKPPSDATFGCDDSMKQYHKSGLDAQTLAPKIKDTCVCMSVKENKADTLIYLPEFHSFTSGNFENEAYLENQEFERLDSGCLIVRAQTKGKRFHSGGTSNARTPASGIQPSLYIDNLNLNSSVSSETVVNKKTLDVDCQRKSHRKRETKRHPSQTSEFNASCIQNSPSCNDPSNNLHSGQLAAEEDVLIKSQLAHDANPVALSPFSQIQPCHFDSVAAKTDVAGAVGINNNIQIQTLNTEDGKNSSDDSSAHVAVNKWRRVKTFSAETRNCAGQAPPKSSNLDAIPENSTLTEASFQ